MTEEKKIKQQEYSKKYRKSEKGKLQQKRYELTRDYKKRYQKEKCKRLKWYQEHKDYFKKWRYVNKSKINSINKNRRKTNINYRIACLLRTRLRNALKGRTKSKHAIELLGCTITEFRAYFQSKFTKEMNWTEFNNGNIHIDHIVPCSKFKLSCKYHQQLCFHYTNIQPLWSTTKVIDGITYIGNINKNDKYEENIDN